MRKQKQKGGAIDPIIQRFISFSGILFVLFSIILIILAATKNTLFAVIINVFAALALLFYSIMQLSSMYNSNTIIPFATNVQLFMLMLISGMMLILSSKYKHYTSLLPITYSLLIASVILIYSFGTTNEGISNGVILLIFGAAVSLVLLIVQQTYVFTKGCNKDEEK
jgi:hypothetical protein